MNTNSNEKETNEISQSPPLPAPEPSGHPGADPSSAPPVTAPPSLQLSFQVKLAEGAVTHMSVETAFALPFSNNASEIALLGEQVKVLFKVMAFDPLLAGVNRVVRLKLESLPPAPDNSGLPKRADRPYYEDMPSMPPPPNPGARI